MAFGRHDVVAGRYNSVMVMSCVGVFVADALRVVKFDGFLALCLFKEGPRSLGYGRCYAGGARYSRVAVSCRPWRLDADEVR